MRGASAGKTMYVIPYLMAPPGNALAPWAAGVELTDARTVVLHMIRMSRVGVEYLENLEDPDQFVRAVHVTGDLENLGQGTAGGPALLRDGRRRAHDPALRLVVRRQRAARQDRPRPAPGGVRRLGLAQVPGRAVHADRHPRQGDRQDYHICGGFPSASGKTNLAMMLAPDALGDRYHVSFYGDDIAWLWVDETDGRLYGMNPEYGVFGVAKDTNESTNPTALASVGPGTGAIFTNVAYNEKTQEVWWEGRTPAAAGRHRRLAGLEGRADRRPRARRRQPVGAPQQPVHHHAGQRPEHRARLQRPAGRADRRDHLRWPHPRPRAADPRDHRPRRGRLRRPHPGRRGDLRRRGRRGHAPLRPDVEPPVHGLRRGRLRRALPQGRRRGHATSRSSRTSTGSSATRRTATSCGPATATTCARCCGCCSSRTARSRAGRRRSASSRPRTSSTSRASTSHPRTSTRSSPSTCRAGGRRWASAQSTSSSSPTCPRRSGRRTAASAKALDQES